MNDLNIKFVSVEAGISALGFRRVAAIARKLHPKTEIYFVTPGNLYSLKNHLFPSSSKNDGLTDKDAHIIAKALAKADLLCFSSMTPCAPDVEKIIKAVRQKNRKVFIIWGGTHGIIYPDDAIKYADAICTGEGEIPFEIFYNAFISKKNFLNTPSMWFRVKKNIIKNNNLKLNSCEQLSLFPHQFYDLSCQIYDFKLTTFRQFTQKDYIKYNGLSYRTIWIIGCPFSCIYCANDAFISYDQNYRKLRYATVNYILDEIEKGLKLYPFVTTIVFYDDNFIAISVDNIREFTKEYKKRINIPFVVHGLHPNFVTREKLLLLAKAGMNRGRMGIQSGSKKMLSFYNRPTKIQNIKKSAKIIAEISKKYNMIPFAYDIIIDNPIETRDDIIKTLILLYKLKKPYTLTIFSLIVFPKTKLYDYFENDPSTVICRNMSSYLETRKSLSSILFYLIAFKKPPKFIFFWLLKYVRGYNEKQKYYPVLYFIVRCIYLSSRAFDHLLRLDFSTIIGLWSYYLWKIGIIKSRSSVK